MFTDTNAPSWIKYSDWHWGCSDSVINIRESSLSSGPRSTPMESPLVVGPGDPFDPGYTELIRVSLGLLHQGARAKGGVMGHHPRLKWRRVLTYRLFSHSFFRTLYIYIYIYTHTPLYIHMCMRCVVSNLCLSHCIPLYVEWVREWLRSCCVTGRIACVMGTLD